MIRERLGAFLLAVLSIASLAPVIANDAPDMPALATTDIPYEAAVQNDRHADEIAASWNGWFVLTYADPNTPTVAEDAVSQWSDAVAIGEDWDGLADQGGTSAAIRYRWDKLSFPARNPWIYNCTVRVDGVGYANALGEAANDKPVGEGGPGSDLGSNAGFLAILDDMVESGFSSANLLPLTFGSSAGWKRDSVLFDPECIRDYAVTRLQALMADMPWLDGVYLANKELQQRNDCYNPDGSACFDAKEFGTLGWQGKEWRSSNSSYVTGQFMPSDLPPDTWYETAIALARAVDDAGLQVLTDTCCGYRGGGAPQVGTWLPRDLRASALEINGITPSTVYVPIADAGADINDATTGVPLYIGASCYNSSTHSITYTSGPDSGSDVITQGAVAGRPQDPTQATFTPQNNGTHTLTVTCQPGGSQDTDTIEITSSGATAPDNGLPISITSWSSPPSSATVITTSSAGWDAGSSAPASPGSGANHLEGPAASSGGQVDFYFADALEYCTSCNSCDGSFCPGDSVPNGYLQFWIYLGDPGTYSVTSWGKIAQFGAFSDWNADWGDSNSNLRHLAWFGTLDIQAAASGDSYDLGGTIVTRYDKSTACANAGADEWLIVNPLDPIAEGALQANAWNEIIVQVKENTPGSADGELNLWANGIQVKHHTGIDYRGPCAIGAGPSLNTVLLTSNNVSVTCPNCSWWYDDVHVDVGDPVPSSDFPPQVFPGPDLVDVGGGSVLISGATVLDEGFPALAWTITSGTGAGEACENAAFDDASLLEPTLESVADVTDTCTLQICADDGINSPVCASRDLDVTATPVGGSGQSCASPTDGWSCIGIESFDKVFAKQSCKFGCASALADDGGIDLEDTVTGRMYVSHNVEGVAGSTVGLSSQTGVWKTYIGEDLGGSAAGYEAEAIDFTDKTYQQRYYFRFSDSDFTPGCCNPNMKHGLRAIKGSSPYPDVETGWVPDTATEEESKHLRMDLVCRINTTPDPDVPSFCPVSNRNVGGTIQIGAVSLQDCIDNWCRVEQGMDHSSSPTAKMRWRIRVTNIGNCDSGTGILSTDASDDGSDGPAYSTAILGGGYSNTNLIWHDFPDWDPPIDAPPAGSYMLLSRLTVMEKDYDDAYPWLGADPAVTEDACP